MKCKAISDEIIREITIISFTDDGLSYNEAQSAAEQILDDEGSRFDWECFDTERISYDRVTVRFVGVA